MSGQAVHVGDVVYSGGGKVQWRVDSIKSTLAWCTSLSSGRRQTHLVAYLRPAGGSRPQGTRAEGVRSAPASDLIFEPSGTVLRAGEVIRGNDSSTACVVEWSAPVLNWIDPNEPSAVSIARQHDREGRKWLMIQADGPGDFGAALTKTSALVLAARIAEMAARLP